MSFFKPSTRIDGVENFAAPYIIQEACKEYGNYIDLNSAELAWSMYSKSIGLDWVDIREKTNAEIWSKICKYIV